MPKIRHLALLMETSKSYGRGLLREIAQYVKEHEPWSTFLELRALITSPPSWLKSWKGDGILARISDANIARVVFKTNLPAVNLSSAIPNLGFPCIETDPDRLASLALAHLLERGLRRFGFFGEDTSFRNWSKRVRIPFLNMVRAVGHDCAVFEFPLKSRKAVPWEQEQKALGNWLRRLPKPVGILAVNDWRGQQLLDTCKRGGLAVPDQVAVIGMENDELVCDMADPPLSSVIMSAEKAGYEAAALLGRMMRSRTPRENNPAIPKLVTIGPLGVATRRSTDIQAHEDAIVAKAIRFIRETPVTAICARDGHRAGGNVRSKKGAVLALSEVRCPAEAWPLLHIGRLERCRHPATPAHMGRRIAGRQITTHPPSDESG